MTTPSGPRPFPGGAQFANVTLNGSGNGQVSLGPQRPREHWQISAIGVTVAPVAPNVQPVANARCSVFAGVPMAVNSQFLSSTFTGSTGDTCPCGGLDIQSGQIITAEWTGGDAGAVATVTVFGTFSFGGVI